MATIGDPASYDLAYQAALHALDEQATTLRDLRERARVLLTLATVVIGFPIGLLSADRLSGTAAAPDLPGYVEFGMVLGTFGFCAVLFFTLRIWWPSGGWFIQDGGTIIVDYIERAPRLDHQNVQRELTLQLSDDAIQNNAKLESKTLAFAMVLVALVVQFAGLIVALGGFYL